MRHTWMILGCFALAAATQAAEKNFDVNYQLSEYRPDYRLIRRPQHQNYGFRMEILSDDNGLKPETTVNGKTTLIASKDERYSIRLYNPLPVQVAVNLTVDGLNSITGKPSGISDGRKWLIQPYSSITIPGWQVNDGESRRFFFTDKHASYAQWQGDRTDKDLAANCGVIGAAYFWSQKDLDDYYTDHPRFISFSTSSRRNSKISLTDSYSSNLLAGGANYSAQTVPQFQTNDMKSTTDYNSQSSEKAGTGMGERESHPTTEVDFKYDTGMYKADQALVVYYEFAQTDSPNPFPALSYAPEMP